MWLALILTAAMLNTVRCDAADILAAYSGFIEKERSAMQEPCDDLSEQRTYDFIIIGAGAAGCVLANRLTEVKHWDVLLLEAGAEETVLMDVPNLGGVTTSNQNSWNYKTVPSKTKLKSFINQQHNYASGKVVGGSTTINFMMGVRGVRQDYDEWERMGNPGWNYEDVLPYFKKVEKMEIQALKNSRYHSSKGNIPINYSPYVNKLSTLVLEAGEDMGYRGVDYNGENQTGFFKCQNTMQNGTRWSASRGYLHKIRGRVNLHLKKRTLVSKIFINRFTRTATGVEYIKDGRKYSVDARKEVILSAGAFRSPQLLMLSGIGPKEHLESLGIRVIKDSSVGRNSMDHASFIGLAFLTNETLGPTKLQIATNPEFFQNYFAYNNGPLTNNFGVQALSFLGRGNIFNHTPTLPEFETVYYSPSFLDSPLSGIAMNANKEFITDFITPLRNISHYQVIPFRLKPKSKGTIVLKDNDIFNDPLYDPNFYDNEEDVTVMIAAIKSAIEISKLTALQKVKSELYSTPVPACKNQQFGSDEYWRCAVIQASHPAWHVCGTCKMGPSSDEAAVVSPKLKVHGIRGLRVVDASVFPGIPSGHTSLPTYMLAEKAADIIKEDYRIKIENLA